MWQIEGTVGCDFQEREVGCWNREINQRCGKGKGKLEVIARKERWDGRNGGGSGCREREVHCIKSQLYLAK